MAVVFGEEDALRISTDKEIADDAGTLHARQSLKFLQHAVEEAGSLRGCQEGWAGDREGEDALRPESQIYVFDGPQASDEETGADEQNDRQGEFRDYQRAANSTRGDASRDASTSVLARGPQVAARHGDGRREPHQDSGEKAKGRGPTEHRGSRATSFRRASPTGFMARMR